MGKVRVFMCCLMLVAASGLVYTYYAYATPRHWDELFHVKSSLASPSDTSSQANYVYAIDHPSIKRHVYRWVLWGMGIREMNIPNVDYSKGVDWNMERGRVPPFEATLALRLTNMVFMTGALVLIYFTALLVMKDPYAALLAPLPLLVNNRIAEGVVGYVGCDAILAFFMALSIFAWVAFAMKGKASSLWGIIAIGAAAGLAVSTKFNGALVIAAYCLYLALANRGADRVIRPLIAAAVCAAVFAALNPVVRGGGLAGTFAAIEAMLRHRRVIWESQYEAKPLSRVRLVARYFGYMSFLPAYVAAAVALRKRKWVGAVTAWAGVLVLATVLSVNRTSQRYFLPNDMGAFTAAALLACGLFSYAKSKATAAAAKRGTTGSAALGIAALAAMLTFVAAYEPWGPYRERTEKSITAKVAVFYKQAAAYYGIGQKMRAAEVKAQLSRTDARGPRRSAPRETLGLQPVRIAYGTSFIAALAAVFLLTRKLTGSRIAGLLILAPLLWNEFAQGTYYGQSPSDKHFAFAGVALLAVWMRIAGGAEKAAWGNVLGAGALAGLCTAVSPVGIALTGATAYVVGRRGRGTMGAVVMIIAAAAVFAAAEPWACYFGARETLAMTRGILSGSLKLWTNEFHGLDMFLNPVDYNVPYWPLVGLGAAALYAVRQRPWAMALALWSGTIVAAALLTKQAGIYRLTADLNFAMTLGAGAPALAMLAERIKVKVTLAEEAVDGQGE